MPRTLGVLAAAVAFALALPLAACSDGGGGDGASSTSAAPAAPAWETLPLQGRPAALTASGDRVLVVDDELGLLQVVDATSRTVSSSTIVGGALVGVAVGPEGASGTWVIDALGRRVARVPPANGTEPLVIEGAPSDVWVGGSAAYVADLEASQVLEVTVGAGVVRRFDVPDGVVRLDGAGDELWVTGRDHTVTRIDLASSVVGPPAEVGNGPIGVVVADGTVWVANGDDGTVSRLDAATGARRGPDLPVGGGPTAIAVHGDDVWVLNHDAATVSHLAAATGQRVEPDLAVPADLSRPRDLVVTDDGTVWVAGVDASLLAVLPPRG